MDKFFFNSVVCTWIKSSPKWSRKATGVGRHCVFNQGFIGGKQAIYHDQLLMPYSTKTYRLTLLDRNRSQYFFRLSTQTKFLNSVLIFRRLFDTSRVSFYATQKSKRNEKFGDIARDLEQARNYKPYGAKVIDSGKTDDMLANDEKHSSNEHEATTAVRQVLSSSSEESSVVDELTSKEDKTSAAKEETSKKPGIFKRFHNTYKEYGKVLVGVHIATSSVWSVMFYLAAASGIDVEPALRWIGANETIISFYTMPGVGHAAVAYLFYKLATPARYTVTIAGTHLTVKYLRRWGYMQPIPESNSLRMLVKDGRTQVKAKYEEYQDKMEDIRDELTEIANKDRKLK